MLGSRQARRILQVLLGSFSRGRWLFLSWRRKLEVIEWRNHYGYISVQYIVEIADGWKSILSKSTEGLFKIARLLLTFD